MSYDSRLMFAVVTIQIRIILCARLDWPRSNDTRM